MLALFIWMTAFAVVLALWVNGRYQRSRWSATPDVLKTRDLVTSDTAVVFFPGAFNSALHVSRGMVATWDEFGDVYLIEYPLRKFDMAATVRTTITTLHPHYQRFILVGASMGGLCCLEMRRKLGGWRSARYVDPQNLKILGGDVPQCAEHLLPLPRKWCWLTKLARYVHPGPIFNFLLSDIATRLMFPLASNEKLSAGTDTEALQQHNAAMRRYRLSAILEQIAAIAHCNVADPSEFVGIDAFYLQSETDGVIRGDEAREAWLQVFPRSPVLGVPKAFHATYVENGPEWKEAHHRGLSALVRAAA